MHLEDARVCLFFSRMGASVFGSGIFLLVCELVSAFLFFFSRRVVMLLFYAVVVFLLPYFEFPDRCLPS